MPTILMIDDDMHLCESLATYFSQFDLELIYANTPSEGLSKLAILSPQLLLLDITMPEMDGFTLCQKIRGKYSLPIIMLTARGKLDDKITGLELGADDYSAKPFEPRELIARVQVLLRRLSQQDDQSQANRILRFEGITLHPDQCQIEVDGNEIKLTGMEFNLLHILAANQGKVFNRNQIISELKGVDVELYSRSVDILLSRVRQKLNDDAKQPRFIKTLRNVGYTFVAKKK